MSFEAIVGWAILTALLMLAMAISPDLLFGGEFVLVYGSILWMFWKFLRARIQLLRTVARTIPAVCTLSLSVVLCGLALVNWGFAMLRHGLQGIHALRDLGIRGPGQTHTSSTTKPCQCSPTTTSTPLVVPTQCSTNDDPAWSFMYERHVLYQLEDDVAPFATGAFASAVEAYVEAARGLVASREAVNGDLTLITGVLVPAFIEASQRSSTGEIAADCVEIDRKAVDEAVAQMVGGVKRCEEWHEELLGTGRREGRLLQDVDAFRQAVGARQTRWMVDRLEPQHSPLLRLNTPGLHNLDLRLQSVRSHVIAFRRALTREPCQRSYGAKLLDYWRAGARGEMGADQLAEGIGNLPMIFTHEEEMET